MLSKKMKKKDALKAIPALKTIEEINAVIAGEERDEVVAAAQIRIQELEQSKQGEQPGPVARQTADF